MQIKSYSIVLSMIFLVMASMTCAENMPLPEAAPESAGFSPERLERLETTMHGFVDEGELSGIVTCVARKGRMVHQSVYGKRDIENNKPMQMDTIFSLASMTKPVTGVAMMILFEEGKWHPADPLAMHFPEFKDLMVYAGADTYGQDIMEIPRRAPTVGDLMTHTAGFSYGFFGGSPVDEMYKKVEPMEVDSMDEFIKRMAKLPLMFHPGEAWVYSVAADIQGALIERLSGMSLADFMRTRIFEPLGMKDTAFFVPKEKLDRLATVYTADEKGLTPLPIEAGVTTQPGFSSGGGGLYSTAGDYLRFAQMLINGGELDGVRLLAPGTVKLMCSNKLSQKLLNGGYGIIYQQIKPGFGFGYDVAVFTDPAFMGSATGKGTYLWSGAAGTWFWNDPTNDIVFIGMIARLGGLPEPNIENLSRTLVHQALVQSERRKVNMDNDRYLWLVTSKPDPKREEEYNKWYDRHVETFFKFPGLKKVVRNRCFQPMQNPDSCPEYVVIYEFDTKEDLEAFLTSDAAEVAKKQYEEEWNGLGEFIWSGWYEPVKKLER